MNTRAAHGQPLRGAALIARFEAVTALLVATRQWWRPAPFQHPRLPWEATAPELANYLRALDRDAVEGLHSDLPALADQLSPWLPAAASVALGTVPQLPAQSLPPMPEPRDVPGRKWAQIQAFLSRCQTTTLPALEWCSGKAHLGRHYAALAGAPVTALEWDDALVAAAQQLAQREQRPVAAHCQDVLAPTAGRWLQPAQQVLALHACGELHRRLLRLCAERRPQALLLSPCCYHLGSGEDYEPLSQQGQRSALQLSREELRIALQETVTAPGREQRQRETLQAWRLGFDLLQRELRGIESYLRTPPLAAPATIAKGFAALCQQLARHHGLTVPAALDLAPWEQAGWRRLAEVRALDLVRALFRPLLELWVVLDYACLLQEHGYEVELGRFCQRSLTPRNLLLRAVLPAAGTTAQNVVENTY